MYCRPFKAKHLSRNCSTKLRNTIKFLDDGVKSLTQQCTYSIFKDMPHIYTTEKDAFWQQIETLDPARFKAIYIDDDVSWVEIIETQTYQSATG